MEKGVFIKDIKPEQQTAGIFLASGAQLAKTRNNRPYWRLKLADVTGELDAKIWQPLCDKITDIPENSHVLASGNAGLYNNALQLSLTAFTILSKEEVQMLHEADFVKSSTKDIDAMFQDLRIRCKAEFVHEPWRKLILAILDDGSIGPAFRAAPAARTLHHNWAGGLLEHTSGVFNLCCRIADGYPELDRQTLLAGSLLHDIGKIRELSSGPAAAYTREGELLGHIMLGLQLIEPFIASSGLEEHLADHLRHLILSHHGQLEYGSPVLPKTAEAMALHHADNLDAKLAQFRQLLENIPEHECTSRPNNLKRAIFRMGHTPSEASISGGDNAQGASAPNSSIAMGAEIIQTENRDEPPLEAYDDYLPLDIPEEFVPAPEFWIQDYGAAPATPPGPADLPEHTDHPDHGKHKHAARKAARAERCSLV